jgi:hypothetical protein
MIGQDVGVADDLSDAGRPDGSGVFPKPRNALECKTDESTPVGLLRNDRPWNLTSGHLLREAQPHRIRTFVLAAKLDHGCLNN